MAITTTVVRKTGIYQVTHTKADDQAGVRECLEGMAKWFNIDWQLEWIEEYALGVLRPQGVTAWPFQVPKDADPLLKDASNAALRVSLVRKALADGNAKDAAINALQLGRTVERMGVRPFEPHAARGIKQIENARRGHESTHGTEQQKQADWDRMTHQWQAMRTAKPNVTKAAIDAEVARRCGVSTKTVQRARIRKQEP